VARKKGKLTYRKQIETVQHHNFNLPSYATPAQAVKEPVALAKREISGPLHRKSDLGMK